MEEKSSFFIYMKVELISKTQGLGKFENQSIDSIIVGQSRISTSRELNELFDEPHKLLNHCILNQHWCVDKETEILTAEGFKKAENVGLTNLVACYNLYDESVYFNYPTNVNRQKYKGKMIGFSNSYIDFLVTPNHRIPFLNKNNDFEVKEAQDIFNKNKRSSKLITYAKTTKESINSNLFKNFNSDIYKLIGFFIGDGSTKTSDAGLNFHLKLKHKIDYLFQICKSLDLEISEQKGGNYIVKSKNLKNVFSDLFYKNNEKTIPEIFTTLPSNFKDNLLDGLLNSDGHINKRGSIMYDTTSKELVNCLQTIFCISGYKITIKNRKSNSIKHKQRYRLYFSKQKYTCEKKGVKGGWFEQNYDDYVYCLSVPTSFIVIRRNGKVSITGNSIFDLANLGFYVETSRAMGREFLRHWSIHPTEFSQRYSSNVSMEGIELRVQSKNNRQSSTEAFNPTLQILDEEWEANKAIDFCIENVEMLYKELLNKNTARETARFILPETTSTQMYFNGTIRSWITFLNARLHQTAQKEIRLIAEQIRDIFIQECPIISKSLFNFENAYNIHILERIVLEKYKVYQQVINK